MYKVGDEVIFNGYKRPPSRGKPQMTAGKTYRVSRDSHSSRYVWVRNDAGAQMPYPIENFRRIENDAVI